MKFRDFPIGTMFLIGREYQDRGSIDWVKCQDNTVFTTRYTTLDGQHTAAPSRNKNAFGTNFYPQTRIHQFLNSSGRDWYKSPFGADDEARIVDGNNNGFLSWFTEDELGIFDRFDIECEVPAGYKRQKNLPTKLNVLFAVPSVEEVKRYYIGPKAPEEFAYFSTATRDPNTGHNFRALSPKYPDSEGYAPGTRQTLAFVMAKIKPDANFELRETMRREDTYGYARDQYGRTLQLRNARCWEFAPPEMEEIPLAEYYKVMGFTA